jgi:hypothetical protein
LGNVVSKLTTTSGENSASTASILATSNTSATTGLAPDLAIGAVFPADRVSPVTSWPRAFSSRNNGTPGTLVAPPTSTRIYLFRAV